MSRIKLLKPELTVICEGENEFNLKDTYNECYGTSTLNCPQGYKRKLCKEHGYINTSTDEIFICVPNGSLTR